MKLAKRVMQRLDKDGRESRLFETGGEGDAARQIVRGGSRIQLGGLYRRRRKRSAKRWMNFVTAM